ncbi:MAG: hypothetical protein AAF502_08335 [Bacteroidota bacterium]
MLEKEKTYLYLLFLVLSGYYLLAFPWQLSASDTIFYLMSAREFSEGQFWGGVNSYWGTLISLLMVPLMWLGLKGLWAFKVAQILIGLVGVGQVWRLMGHFELQKPVAFWAQVTCIVLLWMMTMSHTPDLLMVVLLLGYFNETLKPESSSALKVGIIGGLLFLCKGYGFPFFLAHFSLWTIYQRLTVKNQEQKSLQIKFFLTGMVAFLVIAGSWVSILSVKYDHFTLGSSGSYNMAYMGPFMQFNPPYFDRLHNPETKFTNYFIGEEQGLFADYGKWQPFGSKSGLQYMMTRVFANASKLYYITYLRDLVFLLIMIGGFSWFFKMKLPEKDRQLAISILIFLGVYNAGYFVLFPNERYLWINHILLTIAFFWMLGRLWRTERSSRLVKLMLIPVIIIFGINIIDRIQFRTQENDFHTALQAAKSDIRALQLEGKSVVSNIKPVPSAIPDYMDPTCLLMYENRFKIWGFIRTKKLHSGIIDEITRADIDHFLLWGNHADSSPFTDYVLLYANADIGLRIYDLQNAE